MSFLKNTVSLIAIFSVVPAAYAATARPSVLGNASARRMPTMTAYITGATGSSTVAGNTTSSTLLANAECIDAYTACIKGGEACGTNFEECTTKVLFHAKMPQCLSTLAQCSSAGVNSLFGTSTVSALSNVATKNAYGEITDYTYPTDGSVLGQMISAAAIENMYDTSSCVRRYTSCLRKDSVCGADFELCTTNTEFKKQAVFCDSTLARCASEGKQELFGNAGATSSTVPSASSRIGEMIAEGASLAAVNAVSTCYKVVDQCMLNACSANPYKCYENATQGTVDLVTAINTGTEVTTTTDVTEVISRSGISSYIKNSCLDTVGSNKYCYATFIGEGQMPTASQLRDEDNQEEIYDLAYSARMNSGMKAKIAELVDKFDTKAKEKCVETIRTCAMRTCGSGSGAACYSQVFGAKDKSINNDYTRDEIRTGCAAIVNTDPNCKYAAQNPTATGTYTYTYINGEAFDTLFPEYDDGAENDPIGVISSLNASLATNYSDAAIAQMKKRCQSIATSCVKSMCGNDYVNCYRNRTDIYSSLTNSGDTAFDKSMNKVGGVLDYTIVLGLCVDTVKNADVCSEHLAIETNKLKIANKSDAGSWGTGSVRSDWIDAGGTSHMELETETVQAYDEYGNKLCENAKGEQGICDTVDSTGAIYDKPVTIAYSTYVESQAASTLFKDLIYDLEIEAQAKYNAKLTKQQNMCLSGNSIGGVMGNKDLGSTYLWVKLKSNKVPANYAVSGLKTNQFVASNDLYGSFCRIRVALTSMDPYINSELQKGADWSTAYFAAGDPVTCGSWIPYDKLEILANKAGEDARADKKASQPKIKGWMTALGALGGGAGGAYLGKGIADGSVFGGLTGNKNKSKKLTEENCKDIYGNFEKMLTAAQSDPSKEQFVSKYVNELKDLVDDNDKDDDKSTAINAVTTALREYKTALGNAKQKYDNSTVQCTDEERATVALKYLNAANSDKVNVISPILDWTSVKTKCECSGSNCASDKTVVCGNNNEHYNTAKNAYNGCVPTTISGATLTSEAVAKLRNQETELDNAMLMLRDECKRLADNKDDKGSKIGAGVGAAVGAIGGGILAWQIVDSIQDAELDSAQRAAIQEFMDNVGSKIQCVIGGEVIGTYGETIQTSME